ncbi:diguanylate cyclase [Aquabacterium sp. A7-Y]|uniref:sensor domain-containing diguanylate cyclase n=1 Tax=Aquabacterium sp. A7-Y TaxID=1349605 RepID=UPI00223CA240|nr:7TM diverse intracellular signaling domain-containing protein [Aquabacterium sp. A7-Y]MCW7541943.1 diguanylate cyclase [Aquabacterium sp. A7-Y]
MMLRLLRRLLWLGCLWAVCLGVRAEPVRLDAAPAGIALGRQLRYLEDPQGGLQLQDALARLSQFRAVQQDVPNFGFTASTYWFHLRLQNPGMQPGRWWLEMQYPLLDDVRVHLLRAGGAVSSFPAAGRSFPFDQRPTPHRNLIYPVELGAGETVDVLMRVHTESSLQLPLVAWEPDALALKDRNEQYMMGIYYGVLGSMLVFNLLVFFSMRDKSYLHYVIYIGGYIGFQFALNGLAFEHLWPGWPEFGRRFLPVVMGISAIGALNFTRSFLDVPTHLPRVNRLIGVHVAATAVMTVLTQFGSYTLAIKLASANALLLSLAVSAIGLCCLLRGVREARYFMLAWTTLLAGLALYPLKTVNLVPSSFFTEYAMQIGSALETLLLSFALAHRMKLLKEQNERIQAEATSQLERRVQQRTEELDRALRDLSQANAELQKLNALDGLTGVKNRKHFDEQLALQLKVGQRSGLPTSLLLIDIDHFKAVNDQYGHPAGDACLRAVAGAIARSLYRPTDEVARYGGEEFGVLLPLTDAEGAVFLGERIRTAVEQLDVVYEGRHIPMTVSVGVALRTTLAMGGEQLIAAADTALYAAKHQGRNRVVLAPPLAGAEPAPSSEGST